jgi:SnoaL-like domain
MTGCAERSDKRCVRSDMAWRASERNSQRMPSDPRSVVDAYFNAWKNNDFATMRSVLADTLDFAGPIDTFDNADAYQRAIQGLSQMKTDIVVHKTFVDGPDVLTWYDLHTRIAPPASVAEWSHVEGGKIAMVRVVFDARPFAAAQPPSQPRAGQPVS